MEILGFDLSGEAGLPTRPFGELNSPGGLAHLAGDGGVVAAAAIGGAVLSPR